MPRRVPTVLITLALLCGLVGVASADRSYVVRDGDTLARIARRHHVTVSALSAANPRATTGLRPGQHLTVPDRGTIYVRAGDTLARIARRHDVSVRDLARQNRLRESATLRIGQRLLLPGYEAAEERERAEQRWGTPRHPGVVTLIRMGSGRREQMRLVDSRGRVRRAALSRMIPLMRSRRNGRGREPHRRLLSMLSEISDHFGGRPIHIISGFRPAGGYTRETSMHTRGQALDFRIPGVPNAAVRDFCRTLPRAGVGFYPHSNFVHLDARNEKRYWVDLSRPGERPRYRRPNTDVDTDGADDEDDDAEAVEGGAEPEDVGEPVDVDADVELVDD